MSKRKATKELDRPNKKPNTGKSKQLFSTISNQGSSNLAEAAVKEQPTFASDPSTYGIHVYTQSEIDNSPGN